MLVWQATKVTAADPLCFLTHTKTDSNGNLLIACAVNVTGGELTNSKSNYSSWQTIDRNWIEGALTFQAETVQSLKTSEFSTSTITVDSTSPFHSDALLNGQTIVEISLTSDVVFDGYCQ